MHIFFFAKKGQDEVETYFEDSTTNQFDGSFLPPWFSSWNNNL